MFSVRGILNGDPAVEGGLTAEGVEQARELGRRLRDVPLELVVTSELERAIATADEAVRGRELPRVVMRELNDPRYGPFEGAALENYRAWAGSAPSSASPGDGGESRYAIVARYAAGFRRLVERSEVDTVLVVAHSLPIAYVMAASAGLEPAARMPLVEYATPYEYSDSELEEVVGVLERWLAAPTF